MGERSGDAESRIHEESLPLLTDAVWLLIFGGLGGSEP